MPDLFDYLDWRGDVRFFADPFNEVDNLILSTLAYTDFEGLPEDGSPVAVGEARDRFFSRHDREKLKAASAASARAALLLDGMADGARFRGTLICRSLCETDREKEAQIAAVTFLLDDGTAFAAFRGTDNSLIGWREDFDLSFLPETEGQRRAAVYLDGAARFGLPLRAGGHSKGGNFAVYAAAHCKKETRGLLAQVYTNDGPGFRSDTLDFDGYREIFPKIISIVPDTSIIGRLLCADYPRNIVLSSAAGIAQHDPFTWQVARNRLVRAEQSDAGRFFEKALGEWVEQMDDDTRRSFTDTVFTLFESTGKETFRDIGESKLKSAEAMIKSMAGLPKEKRGELARLIGELIQTGGHTALEVQSSKLKD